MLIPIILIIANILAWYPVLNFWFLGGWEPAWLIGICGYNFDFICLMQSHGILSLFNYTVFGWNPWGWYLSAMVLHISSVLLVYLFSSKIFKNGLFAFLIALLFGLNVAHNDVINWGSFEGLYALLMVLFLFSILSYLRSTVAFGIQRFLWYGLSLLLYLFALFVREIALSLPFFIIITELYKREFVFSLRNIKGIFYLTWPFIVVSVLYLFLRNWYGGAPHDFIDGMVQLRISLLGQGQYGEYIFLGILSFGRYASSHLIPYPMINEARDLASHLFYAPYVAKYFFPIIGIGYFLLQIIIVWLFRKNKRVVNILIFALLWFLIPTIFFSFAFSITQYELERPLVWNYTRWRYFAFLGTVIFWLTVFLQLFQYTVKRYAKYSSTIRLGFIGLLVFYILLNMVYLRIIQKDIYETSFKPAKEFYQSLTNTYKTLPEEYVFYYFPFAPSLNDRLAEFYYLRREYYPNLTEERRDWTEGHMGMVLEQLENKNISYENIIFLDLDEHGGFYDRTADVTNALQQVRSYTYSLSNGDELMKKVNLDPALHVEFPYTFEITARAIQTQDVGEASLSSSKLSLLRDFSEERLEYLSDMSVKVCKTASIGARSADAMQFLPKNMTDGNLGKRSFWAADCRPAWVILDLKESKSISGLLFRGEPNGPNVPSEYTIEISNDNTHWKKVLSKSYNTSYQKIELFPETLNARYVRFTAVRTTEGGMLMLDELEVLGENGEKAASLYGDDVERFLADTLAYGHPHLHFFFETEPTNFAPEEISMHNSVYVPLILDGQSHTYRISPNENEYFSAQGQFLKRYIKSVSLDSTGYPHIVTFDTLKITPIFNPWYIKK